MKRRTYLISVGTSVTALAGCTAIGAPQNESQADYQGEREVVYEHDDLQLRLLQEAAHLGDTVTLEVTNISDSTVILGCDNPWALQQRTPSGWRHVTWTDDRYYDLCATELPPDDSHVEKLELSENWLENQADTVETKLRPGTYRFLLLGPSPFLAADFKVNE